VDLQSGQAIGQLAGCVEAAYAERERHMLLKCGILIIAGAAVTTAVGQDGKLTNTPRAREAFLAFRRTESVPRPPQPARGPTGPNTPSNPETNNNGGRGGTEQTPESTPLALRYVIQQERPAGNGFDEVNSDKIFSSGDNIRVILSVNQPVYVYAAQKGTSGKWEVLFPPSNNPAANFLSNRYEDIQLPQGSRAWSFKGDPGLEHLFIAVSRQKISDLQEAVEKAISDDNRLKPESRPATGTAVQFAKAQFKDDVVARMLRTRDLSFQKVDSNVGGSVEHAVYYANEANPTGPVVAEIKLKHQP